MKEFDELFPDLKPETNPEAVADCYLTAGIAMQKLSDLAALFSNINMNENQDAVQQLILAVQRFQSGIEKVSQDVEERTRDCIKHDTSRTMTPKRLKKKTKKAMRWRPRSLKFSPRLLRYALMSPICNVDPNNIHLGPEMNDITPAQDTGLNQEDEEVATEMLAQEDMNF
ncbi:hypothetical protein L596_000742 [Steinernema carpocapsae]|uniref:Uncharacterized protein n=1 Tax=Steinernema carpocapsae TaxID=34508 RepID=A0A4U8UJN7_STECR|nr:hypothetical protein L596_000742 [Steinernema carpocapsae]